MPRSLASSSCSRAAHTLKEETLSRYDHPLAAALLSHKKIAKVLGTYGASLLEKVEEDGRIYPSWYQIGVGTGRMACSKPNLQNLPPEVRKHVRAPKGRTLVKADYSQIELRIAAKISGDERMLEAYERGEDLHNITARGITGQEEITKGERKLAKAVNFGLIYGQGAQGLKTVKAAIEKVLCRVASRRTIKSSDDSDGGDG